MLVQHLGGFGRRHLLRQGRKTGDVGEHDRHRLLFQLHRGVPVHQASDKLTRDVCFERPQTGRHAIEGIRCLVQFTQPAGLQPVDMLQIQIGDRGGSGGELSDRRANPPAQQNRGNNAQKNDDNARDCSRREAS